MNVQLEWKSLIALAELMSQNVTSQTVNSAGLQVAIQSLRQERTKLQCKAAEEKYYGWMDFYFFLYEALKKTNMRLARQMIDMQNRPMKNSDGGVFVRFNTCQFTRPTILKTSQQITHDSWGGEKILKVRKSTEQMFPTASQLHYQPKSASRNSKFSIKTTQIIHTYYILTCLMLT